MLAKVRLSHGFHEQPNDDGYLCLVEAAIIAAGFRPRAVKSSDDCPACFSKVIAQYAIALNDAMPDRIRNELLPPFIIRIARTAATTTIEEERIDYIIRNTLQRIKYRDIYDRFNDLGNIHRLTKQSALVCRHSVQAFATYAVRHKSKRRDIWTAATGILDGLIKIGQASPIIPPPHQCPEQQPHLQLSDTSSPTNRGIALFLSCWAESTQLKSDRLGSDYPSSCTLCAQTRADKAPCQARF
jgi:hypothetical protein